MVRMEPAALAPVAARLARAEPEHRAGDFFEDVGEILGAHHRIVHRQPRFLAENLLDDRLAEGDRAAVADGDGEAFLDLDLRSEEHTSELQSLMRHSYAVFCLTTKKYIIK